MVLDKVAALVAVVMDTPSAFSLPVTRSRGRVIAGGRDGRRRQTEDSRPSSRSEH